MASLNTLRTKFGVALSIIIALALLAFIFSLKTEMGFSDNDPLVGEIDGDEIHYSEYYNLYEQIKETNQIQESDEQQSAMLANNVWQTLISKHVLTPGFDDLGLRFTEEERMDIISGKYPSRLLYSYFADPRTGEYNVAAVNQFLMQAEANPQAQQMWAMLNQEIRNEREFAKYFGLVRGGVFVNALEVANGVAAQNNNFSGKWISKKYAEVADSLVSVSNSDIKAYYAKHQNAYKQLPNRTLSYVVFEVAPTEDDMLNLENEVKGVGEKFVVAENLKSFVRSNRNGKVAENYVSAKQLTDEEAEALMAGKAYGPVLKNNEWTMARVLDSKMAPDSLGMRHIVLPFSEEKLADSLMNVLKHNGAAFADLAKQYSVYEATAANGGEVGMVPFSSLSGEFVDALYNAKNNDIVKISMGEAIQLIQVYKVGQRMKHVQLASIVYPVEASDATRRNIHNQAGSFTVNAKGSIEAFNDAASVAAITPRIANLAQGERLLRGMEDSRDIVRWACEAKPEDLSEIFNVGKDYVIAMLTEIDDEEYTPIEKVAGQIRQMVMRDKKYDYIVKQLSGATLEEQAQSIGSEVADFKDVNMGSFYIDQMGVEPRVAGAIASSEKDVVSAPVKGLSGVFVFRVDNIATSEKQTAEAERVRAQATMENISSQYVMPAVQQMAQIKDLRGKYF